MKNRLEIEKLVESLLRKHAITEAPIPVKRIANAEGLPIIETEYGADVSGALISANGLSGIAINAAQHPNRQRFTIAHELAHFLLRHDSEHVDRNFTILLRDDRSSEATDWMEMEANSYAACLLMPREFLLRDLRLSFYGEPDLSEEQIVSLARKYKVSATALRYRLVNLGLLSPV